MLPSNEVQKFNITEDINQQLQQLKATRTEATVASKNNPDQKAIEPLILVPPSENFTGLVISPNRVFYVNSENGSALEELFSNSDSAAERWSGIFSQEPEQFSESHLDWSAGVDINGSPCLISLTREETQRQDCLEDLKSKLDDRLKSKKTPPVSASYNPFKKNQK